ncbi:hypothetical protein SUGI_0508120 [Cryptomeria japonica]|uniref:2-oxoglutarate-dependent dioxygenase 21, chloroplastic n=1 Tax=Cryptomeria japonica TaxID=3369 RepID=UPI0024089E97|nr:2-oxoglutarate-dependent dioxygenase 21, chloroplastic [Cryptomeria japonica]GLJ26372.1 hypothetical protein SUGI_0508120 [Cryptomeria japonica]
MSGAPPPSPRANNSSANGNNDEFNDYLEKLGRSLSGINLGLPSKKMNTNDCNLSMIDMLGERDQVVKKLAEAAKEFGCFQVINHGVSLQTVARAEEESNRLFQLPLQKKEEISGGLGSPFGFDDDGSDDSKKEWFFLQTGSHHIQDFLRDIWPEGCVDFSCAMGEYCDALQRVEGEILELLLEGLGGEWGKDERTHFLAEVESNDSSVLCITNHKGFCHSEDQDRIRLALPFILCLQYQTSASFAAQLFLHNTWVSVFPQPGSLFVIVGDILNVWSNGEYKSVVVRPVPGRMEEAFAVMALIRSPSTDMSISPILEALDSDKKKPVYSSIDLKEYTSRVLRQRFVFEDPLQRYRID